MKNKVFLILLCLVMTFSFIAVIFAEELVFTMSLSTDDTEVSVGDEATITVSLKSDSAISKCLFNVESDSTLELVSKSGLNNWNFDSYDDTEEVLISNSSLDNVAYTDGKNIFNLRYKVNGDGNVSIKNIKCVSTSSDTDEDGNAIEIEGSYQDISVSFTTKNVSEDTTLSSLVVNGGKLLPEFSSNVFLYMIELDSPNFSLDMTTTNAEFQDKIVLIGTLANKLDPKNITFSNDGGQGYMYMKVLINNNILKPYELVAHYELKELDNSLSLLKINGKEVGLKDDQTDYTVEVASNVTDVIVEAELKDSENFQFREGNEPGIFKLSGGSISIALVVVPKNSQIGATSKTYIIEVVKKTDTSSSSSSNIGSSSSSNTGNIITNPGTGEMSILFIVFILVLSLVGSVILYLKKIDN